MMSGLIWPGIFSLKRQLPKMKNLLKYLCLASFIIVLISSFSGRHLYFDTIKDQVKNTYLADLRLLISSVQKLSIKSRQLGHENIDEFKKLHLQVRIQYKKIEFLTEYLDSQFSRDFLNGAPLPKLERNNPNVTVIQPEGLQVLDELIFLQNPLEEKQSISNNLEKLNRHLKEFLIFQESVSISHREIIESLRYSLIRIYTLGLTGFDTPGSLNAIHEAEASWKKIRDITFLYMPVLKKSDKVLAGRLINNLDGGVSFLKKNTNFESFDRLAFLKSYLNPVYADLLQLHQKLQIETFEEVSFTTRPVNYESTNIFGEDFLNPFAFSTFSGDSLFNRKQALGQLLFFDPVLSGNNKRSCASCHNPKMAFTDGHRRSLAFDFSGKVERNAPTLINAIFANQYFYDLRAERIEDQVEHVMVSKKEFHSDFFEAGNRIMLSQEYVNRFKSAFPNLGEKPVNRETITRSLSAYVQSLVALNSPFDQYIRGESDSLSNEAIKGFNLFMGKAACGTCHFAPHFSGLVPPFYKENESEVLGVPSYKNNSNSSVDPDLGRFANQKLLEKSMIYQHSFKTPTLRNVELTAPYMHNGVFDTLEEVVDFYNKGGGFGLDIKLENQTLPADPLGLDAEEVSNLIAFMISLTDTSGISGIPEKLPLFPAASTLSDRLVGGEY